MKKLAMIFALAMGSSSFAFAAETAGGASGGAAAATSTLPAITIEGGAVVGITAITAAALIGNSLDTTPSHSTGHH